MRPNLGKLCSPIPPTPKIQQYFHSLPPLGEGVAKTRPRAIAIWKRNIALSRFLYFQSVAAPENDCLSLNRAGRHLLRHPLGGRGLERVRVRENQWLWFRYG